MYAGYYEHLTRIKSLFRPRMRQLNASDMQYANSHDGSIPQPSAGGSRCHGGSSPSLVTFCPSWDHTYTPRVQKSATTPNPARPEASNPVPNSGRGFFDRGILRGFIISAFFDISMSRTDRLKSGWIREAVTRQKPMRFVSSADYQILKIATHVEKVKVRARKAERAKIAIYGKADVGMDGEKAGKEE